MESIAIGPADAPLLNTRQVRKNVNFNFLKVNLCLRSWSGWLACAYLYWRVHIYVVKLLLEPESAWDEKVLGTTPTGHLTDT